MFKLLLAASLVFLVLGAFSVEVSADEPVGMVSIGVSNTQHHWQGKSPHVPGGYTSKAFMPKLAGNPGLKLADGAQPGQDTRAWATNSAIMANAVSEVEATGLDQNNVHVVWFQIAFRQTPALTISQMAGYAMTVVQQIKGAFPNAVIYVSGLEYMGYGGGEPLGYNTNLAAKEVVRRDESVRQGPNLWSYKPGRYLYARDGGHPSVAGIDLNSNKLITFFRQESWFPE